MAKRLDKTLADYVVGGVMPALLMGLLMSLCFFLLELAYSGAYLGQLKWILFFFIVGTVLIARISMRGDISERAALYGIGLAIAAGLAMVRFVDIPPSALGGFGWLIPFSLMSIIWWSAHKLTQDSTWDDEDEEDGGGLLDNNASEPVAVPKSKSEEWFNQYQQQREDEQRRKKPGLMVVYFSLAALPLFGVGQAMIPATDLVGRRYAFWMLTIYVACGLGMLLTTSFLGLRRYLRGRRLQMPASMTALWLGLGAALIFTLMVLSAVLLPRPEAEYHLSQWFTLSSKERDANNTHFFEGSSGKSDQSGSGPENKQQQQGGKQAQQGNKQGNPQQRNNRQQQGQSDKNAQAVRAGNKKSDQQNQGQSQGQGKQQSQGKQSQGNQSQGEQGQGDQSNSSEQNSKSGKSDRANGKSSDKRQGKNASSEQDDKQQGDKQGENGESSQDPSQQGREGNQGNKNEKRDKPNAGQGQSKQDDQNEQGNQGEPQQEPGAANSPPPPPPPPQASQAPSASWDWLKWLFYALLLGGILFALWKWGRQLWNGLLQIWKEILSWWYGLFPAQDKAKDSETNVPDVEANLPPKPFAWFTNPLLNPGNFRSMEEMIRYSFAALHSWAYENRLARQPDETPLEFAQRLGQSMKFAHQDIRKLTDLYAVVTYANKQAPSSSEAILRNFWNRIQSLSTVS